MRVTTQKVTAAWLQGKRKTLRNTRTDGYNIYLHGNCIAKRDADGTVYITDAGWQTPTTRERLNGILRAMGIRSYVYQKDHALYFNDAEWDGGWMMIR